MSGCQDCSGSERCLQSSSHFQVTGSGSPQILDANGQPTSDCWQLFLRLLQGTHLGRENCLEFVPGQGFFAPCPPGRSTVDGNCLDIDPNGDYFVPCPPTVDPDGCLIERPGNLIDIRGGNFNSGACCTVNDHPQIACGNDGIPRSQAPGCSVSAAGNNPLDGPITIPAGAMGAVLVTGNAAVLQHEGCYPMNVWNSTRFVATADAQGCDIMQVALRAEQSINGGPWITADAGSNPVGTNEFVTWHMSDVFRSTLACGSTISRQGRIVVDNFGDCPVSFTEVNAAYRLFGVSVGPC